MCTDVRLVQARAHKCTNIFFLVLYFCVCTHATYDIMVIVLYDTNRFNSTILFVTTLKDVSLAGPSARLTHPDPDSV